MTTNSNKYINRLNENEVGNVPVRLSFPADLFSVQDHVMQIAVLHHNAGQVLYDPRVTGGVEPRSALAQIYLPIPQDLTKEHNIEYSNSNSVLAAIKPFAKRLAGPITAGAEALLDMKINPFMYVSFQRPSFREYQFSWTLVPRSPEESSVIETIRRMLEFYSQPRKDIGGVKLQYPQEMRVRFLWNNYGKWSDIIEPRYKTAFITNIKTEFFDGDQTMGFFRGTRDFLAQRLTISMMENEITSQDDYALLSMSERGERVETAGLTNLEDFRNT